METEKTEKEMTETPAELYGLTLESLRSVVKAWATQEHDLGHQMMALRELVLRLSRVGPLGDGAPRFNELAVYGVLACTIALIYSSSNYGDGRSVEQNYAALNKVLHEMFHRPPDREPS